MKALSRRPSPAIVVAVAALALALVGTAVAGTDGLTAKITKAKVKSIAIKQIDNAAPGLSVDHATSADTATNATNATNATTAGNVNGQTAFRVFAKIPVNSTQTIATFDVFTLRATCTAAGQVEDLLLDPSTTDTDSAASGDGNVGPIFTRNQGTEDNSISLDQDATNDNSRGTTTFSAARTGGLVLSGNIAYNDSRIFDREEGCTVYGHVTQGG